MNKKNREQLLELIKTYSSANKNAQDKHKNLSSTYLCEYTNELTYFLTPTKINNANLKELIEIYENEILTFLNKKLNELEYYRALEFHVFNDEWVNHKIECFNFYKNELEQFNNLKIML